MVFGLSDSIPPPPPIVHLGYAQVQLSVAGAALLPPLGNGEPVIFDDPIVDDNHNIVTYNDTTGVFTLNSSGTYLVTWELPVSATDTKDYVYMTLELNGEDYSTCHMPLPIGVLSGSAIVPITLSSTRTSATLRLVNSTGDLVEITDLCNMVVTQVAKTANAT
jgi:hypothetical protein